MSRRNQEPKPDLTQYISSTGSESQQIKAAFYEYIFCLKYNLQLFLSGTRKAYSVNYNQSLYYSSCIVRIYGA